MVWRWETKYSEILFFLLTFVQTRVWAVSSTIPEQIIHPQGPFGTISFSREGYFSHLAPWDNPECKVIFLGKVLKLSYPRRTGHFHQSSQKFSLLHLPHFQSTSPNEDIACTFAPPTLVTMQICSGKGAPRGKGAGGLWESLIIWEDISSWELVLVREERQRNEPNLCTIDAI